MRLLNVKTLQLETFEDSYNIPKYAALSHTWADEEVTFEDLNTDCYMDKPGWAKILGCVTEAKLYGYEYVWIDTCCINKSSSAELSEAINSMFRWYRESQMCFAYLDDVSPVSELKECETDFETGSEVEFEFATPNQAPSPSFHESRWFTRGWTLQELIAPTRLRFYESAWNAIGDKLDLEQQVTDITGIDSEVLRDWRRLYSTSIARRMSWASRRHTTRVEDIAYCLMGIFDVNMPLLYGEGEKAFIRLQEEIMKSNYDQTLFAWEHNFETRIIENPLISTIGVGFYVPGILASHPTAFSECANIIPHTEKLEPYQMTNRGLQISLRLIEGQNRTYYGILHCRHADRFGSSIAIPLLQVMGSKLEFYRCSYKKVIEVGYLEVLALQRQIIYIHKTNTVSWGSMPVPPRYCLMQCPEAIPGLKLLKTMYVEDPGFNQAFQVWDRMDQSILWGNSTRIRVATYFSDCITSGTFIVAWNLELSFIREFPTAINIYIKETQQAEEIPSSTMQGFLSRQNFQESDFTSQGFGEDEAEATLSFNNRVITAGVKRKMFYGDDVYVLELCFSGGPETQEEDLSRDAGESE